MSKVRRAAAFVLALGLGTGAVGAGPGARSGDALAVREGIRWVTWWRQEDAPARWDGHGPLAERVQWRPGSDGVEWGELQLRGASEAWRTRVVVARIDPRRIALSLAPAFAADQNWTVSDADHDVAVALDAGQFRGSLPWGWVVHRGRELLAPQYGLVKIMFR